MEDKEIIYGSLSFLVDKYGFKYKYFCTGKEYYYSFQNKHGTFTIYEWPQFQDRIFYITLRNTSKIAIDIFKNHKHLLEDWEKKHSGFIWIFKDKRKDYWLLVAQIIREQINTDGQFWGIKI